MSVPVMRQARQSGLEAGGAAAMPELLDGEGEAALGFKMERMFDIAAWVRLGL